MVKITITDKLDKREMERIAKEKGKATVKEISEEIFKLSQERCPVDTGTLKGSGYIGESAAGFEVGYNCPYVEYVDAMPQLYLDREGHGGKAHFFSGSVQEVLQGMVKKNEYN